LPIGAPSNSSADRWPNEHEQSSNGQHRGKSDRLILSEHDLFVSPVSQRQISDDRLAVGRWAVFDNDAPPGAS
jgi:hypothetical protein